MGPGQGAPPSVGEIAAVVEGTGADEVIVLPNDRDTVLAARQAASMTPEVKVRVVATRNAAEGIAAALAFDGEASLDDNARRMESEASTLRSFTVITAAKDSVVDGQQVRLGDIIALDAGRHIVASGGDVIEATTLAALARLDDFELVTLYCGSSLEPEAGEALRGRIEQGRCDVEVEVVQGGQPHDHLLVAVE